MRRYMVAGNWKLNMGPSAGADLAAGIQDRLAGRTLKGEALVCPPYVTIPAVSAVATGQPLLLGAQDCSDQDQGAYTGQVSAGLLKEDGCTHVIVAHSERRQYHAEDDALVNAKVKAAYRHGLVPIMCIGEVKEEREAGIQEQVTLGQLDGGLADIPAEPPPSFERVASRLAAKVSRWATSLRNQDKTKAVWSREGSRARLQVRLHCRHQPIWLTSRFVKPPCWPPSLPASQRRWRECPAK